MVTLVDDPALPCLSARIPPLSTGGHRADVSFGMPRRSSTPSHQMAGVVWGGGFAPPPRGLPAQTEGPNRHLVVGVAAHPTRPTEPREHPYQFLTLLS